MSDDHLLDALEDLTQDGSFHDAMERLYLMSKIAKGIQQVEEGKVLQQGEAWEQFKSWNG